MQEKDCRLSATRNGSGRGHAHKSPVRVVSVEMDDALKAEH